MNPITPLTQYHNSSPSGRPEGANPHLTIVKVGGAVVEDTVQLERLLNDFAAIKGRKILVHGGGRRATQVASRLGIESRMVGGRRITDSDMLEVVTMVYGGLVNKTIVAGLQAAGVNALGLTGADMDIIRSRRRPVKDTMAAETAKALAKSHDVTLIYSFEKPGVLRNPDDDSSLIPTITHDDFARYKADGTISGGMIPKVENALAAVDAGVSRVIITLASAIDGRHGTVVTK